MNKDDGNYLKRLKRTAKRLEIKLNKAWTKYRETKRVFWELIRDPDYLSGRGKGNVALLVIWLVAVYFLDLLFSWTVAEFVAKQAFHGIQWAIYLATFIFPLAYVTIEIIVNNQASLAKENADRFDRDRSVFWIWVFWMVISLLMAAVMPIAYITTGLADMASSGNSIFLWLLGGLTLLAFLVHVMLIFSGDNMLAAKHRLMIMISYNWRHRRMQKSYYWLMEMLGSLQSVEQDYYTMAAEVGASLPPQVPTTITSHIVTYIAEDYHHLPFGEDPPPPPAISSFAPGANGGSNPPGLMGTSPD